MTVDHTFRTPHGTIGNAIRQLREEREMTQVQLAKKINRTQSAVAYYENGRIVPSVMTVRRLAAALDVSVDFLIGHRRSLV